MDYIARMQKVCIDLATEEIFPNLFRNYDFDNLFYFNTERIGAINSIEVLLSEVPESLSRDCKVVAIRAVNDKLKSFEQKDYAALSPSKKRKTLNEMVLVYTNLFAVILEGSDFDVNQYVDSLRKRRYDARGLPSDLNIKDD